MMFYDFTLIFENDQFEIVQISAGCESDAWDIFEEEIDINEIEYENQNKVKFVECSCCGSAFDEDALKYERN